MGTCLQAQAEETLNTLHFASMALRVKCNPLCILDPQDKLVLNLRGTITKLKTENHKLSTALQRSRSNSNSNSGSRESARGVEVDYQEVNCWLQNLKGHVSMPTSTPCASLTCICYACAYIHAHQGMCLHQSGDNRVSIRESPVYSVAVSFPYVVTDR